MPDFLFQTPANLRVGPGASREVGALLSGMGARRVLVVTDAGVRIAGLLAGQSFTNAPVAAVHALAYPIGGLFHVPHGVSNALMLPHVLRFNQQAAGPLYAELTPLVGAQGAEGFIAAIEQLCDDVAVPRRLRDVGITEADIDRLAQDAMNQTRLLVNNPREVGLEDARALYRAAF